MTGQESLRYTGQFLPGAMQSPHVSSSLWSSSTELQPFRIVASLPAITVVDHCATVSHDVDMMMVL